MTTCSPNCDLPTQAYSYVDWVQASIATTITAATVVLVVNNGTNSTRTSTVYNTELGGYTLPDTNSAGTKVSTITQSDYLAGTKSTKVM